MRFNLSEWSLRHRPLVVYFMIVLVAAGIWSYLHLGRSEDPVFTVKTMVVQAQWPGATLEETVQQLTERLERKLQETPQLDVLRSFTRPGISTIFVQLRGDTPARDVPEIWYQVRKKVDDIRGSLPVGVLGPAFNDEFGDTYGIVYAFTADGFTERELRDYVEEIRSELLRVPDAAKVNIVGAQDERIFIEFSTERIAALGLHPSTLIDAVQAQNAVRPAGVLQTGQESLSVQVGGAFRSEEELSAVTFAADGRLFRLSDIATVRRGYVDPPQPSFRFNGETAIGIAISMKEGGDIITLGRQVRQAMARITANLPVGIEPHLVADQAATVDEAVSDFLRSLWEAIAIVLAVSFLALGVRAGAVVALAIPLTLAMVFPLMMMAGIDLQRVSLGALIIALGLLVDDATTTVDVMVTRLDQGDSSESAATFAYTSLAFPMLTGTFVTWAGFLPIGFARSSAGEYTFSLFAVVGMALVTSWIVAVVFSPLQGALLLRPTKRPQATGPGAVLRAFQRVLAIALRARWITIVLTLAIFAGSILGFSFVEQEFFPASDRPELVIDLRTRQNASIYQSDQLASQLDNLLRDDPEVSRWSTNVGQGAIRFYLPLNVQMPSDAISQTIVVAKDLAARERLRQRLETALERDFPGVVSQVYPLALGPSTDWPLQYRVSGPDVTKVRALAFRVADVLGSDPRARNVNFDWIEPARVIRVNVDQDQARLLGVSSQALGAVINTVMSGVTVTQLRDDRYLIDVVVRAEAEQRVSLDTLSSLQVPISDGRTVPLVQFASFEYLQDYPVMWRHNRVPTINVMAATSSGTLPSAVDRAVQTRLVSLRKELPAGYRLETGGIAEESALSQASVLAVVPLMVLAVLTILMIQLQSFQRLFLVLSVAPLGLIGIVAGLLLSGRPLGFVAILGILSLIGMIARNAVILIDQIETERAQGAAGWDAIISATCSRFRPIMLSAAATVLGMIPIAYTVFWGPMAFAIMGGLAVATLLTLLFLPALYAVWFGIQKGVQT
ncbi:efflux RND transporter permease subunit [Sinorhizobium meliloti]|uniref:efflux RND transporter permease subunit n=1 Tax=Rhizobium meliloti TaxID=382 RepID=UPI000FD8ECD8|nr:efflux RND transporter permease subunit [Sinorhizobium meliloti]RVG73125.1 efflux RND transporter permease subunit [Sinorhizobium meliloti]